MGDQFGTTGCVTTNRFLYIDFSEWVIPFYEIDPCVGIQISRILRLTVDCFSNHPFRFIQILFGYKVRK